MQFSAIPGHQDIKQVLIKAAQNQKVAHGLLFKGQEGTANLTLAISFATYLNCEQPTDTDSCGACSSCKKMSKLAHPDVNFFFPMARNENVPKNEPPSRQYFIKDFRNIIAKNPYLNENDWAETIGVANKQLSISVDEARVIKDSVTLVAYEGKYKVVIIWLPEYFNTQAANALLKILEEPQPQTLFFLVTNEPEQLIITITSRTQAISVPQFDEQQIADYLIAHEGIQERQAQQIALLSDGNLNAAIKMIAHETDPFFPFFSEWMRHCFGKKVIDMIDDTDVFAKLGREVQKSFLLYSCQMIRKAFVMNKQVPELVKLPKEEFAFIEKFSPYIHLGNIDHIFEMLSQGYTHIERNGNPKMIFLDSSLQLMQAFRQPAP
jgi:DNA polymerase-3 subunit delta'